MSKDISKALKKKTDAQLRLLEQDAAPIVRESNTGENFIADPNEYSQQLLAGKNITITTAGNTKTINAVMGLLAGDNITISAPDEDGKVTITGTVSDGSINGKDVSIADYTGKDGYVLSYDETNDQFVLTEASGGGSEYTLPQATESALGGIKAKEKTTESAEVAIDTITGKLFAPASGGGTGSDAESILTIPVNIADFTGKDGFALIYIEQSNEFVLSEISGGDTMAGFQIGWDIILYDTIILTNIDLPI